MLIVQTGRVNGKEEGQGNQEGKVWRGKGEDKKKVEGVGEAGNNQGGKGKQLRCLSVQETFHRPLHADGMEGVIRNIRT